MSVVSGIWLVLQDVLLVLRITQYEGGSCRYLADRHNIKFKTLGYKTKNNIFYLKNYQQPNKTLINVSIIGFFNRFRFMHPKPLLKKSKNHRLNSM